MPDEIEVTELIEIDPSRVDAVGSPANGTEWLMLKAIDGTVVETEVNTDEVLAEIAKADDNGSDDKGDCTTCDGSGKIMDGHRKCPKCLGTGNQPKVGQSEKELLESAKSVPGSAESGAPVPVRKDCPTCNGSGTLPSNAAVGADEPTECPDCDGTGNDSQMPPPDKLNAQPGFAGATNDGDGRTTVDKATVSTADQNDLPDSDFAYIEPGGEKDSSGKTTPRSLRHFPIMDAAHVRNALARAPQSPFGAKAMPKIKAAAKKFGIDVSAKSVEDAETVEKDGVVSGVNPFLGGSVTGDTSGDDSETTPIPGSPDWEAADAQLATDAANALLQAAELIRQFADREAIEVAAGEANDMFDVWDAQCAGDAVRAALGIIAVLAFHEGVAAQKSTDEVVEKKGKRLSTKSVTALAAARDHLSALLGDDDPANASDDDNAEDAEKASDDAAIKAILAKEIDDMTADELTKVLDGRDEKLVQLLAEALKGKAAMDEADAVAGGKNANNKAKKKDPKADMTDLEDEADQGDSDSANSSPSGAAKATDEEVELTPEEIEAKTARKEAKKALRAAEEVEKQAAENARTAKAIEEAVTKATEAVASLQDQLKSAQEATEARLATIEKMAAPGGPVKTRTPEMAAKAADRDSVEIRIASLERAARETSDPDLRKGNLAIVKELRASLASNPERG